MITTAITIIQMNTLAFTRAIVIASAITLPITIIFVIAIVSVLILCKPLIFHHNPLDLFQSIVNSFVVPD